MVFTCPVCESVEYDKLDGLFFCRTCCTQSQEIHEQELEVTFLDGGIPHLRKIQTAKGKRVGSRNLGRPWTIYEGYQCIILAQCDALISLGAKEDLKDVVFLLWANYLSKLKIAFCKNEQLVPEIVKQTGRGRQRELQRGTLEKPWNRGKSGSKRKREDDSSDSESDLDLSNSLTFMVENLADQRSKSKALKSVEWMDLKKTAAFCFIGLRATNPQIRPRQFLRWIYEGKVPFLSTTHLLNSDMVLFWRDFYLFQPVSLTAGMLTNEMNKMTCYFKAKIPTPSIDFMIGQLVDSLHLPNELKEICVRFHTLVPFSISNRATDDKKMDFAAVQYIGLAMKMIFGLDDYTECHLSEYSQEVQKLIGQETKLFVWNEWRKYQMDKIKNEFDAYQVSKQKIGYNLRDIDLLLDCYHNLHLEERQMYQLLDKRATLSIVKNRNVNFSEGLGKPLEMALASYDKNKDVSKNVTPKLEKDVKNRFSESSLAHIVDVKVFKARFKDRMDKRSWKALNHRRKKLCKDIVYKNYSVDDEETMHETRPNSYMWLLELLSNTVDCYIVKLDIALLKLLERLENKMIKNS